MMKAALHSLWDDYQRSLFYWLTFLLTTLFVYVFFQIACSPAIGMSFIHSRNDVMTYLCVFVIFLCMFAVFFANDFYVKKKSQELAVQLVCGATFLQLTVFLLSQTAILFLIAVPIALIIGQGLILMAMIVLDIVIPLTQEGFVITFVVLFCEIFWCTLLNLGYAYRSSIKALIQGDKVIKLSSIHLPFHFHIVLQKGLSLFILIVPVILFYAYGDEPSSMVVFSIVGMIGISNTLNKVVIPYMDQWIQKELGNQNKLIYLGFLRRDIQLMKNNILFLIISSILMVSIFVMSLNHTIYLLLIFISYCVSHCLLSLTIMFRFSTEMLSRKPLFLSLKRIGYENCHLDYIMKVELLLLYGLIFIISLFYILNMLLSLYLYSFITLLMVCLMIFAFVLPLLMCALLNAWQYIRLIDIRDKDLKRRR